MLANFQSLPSLYSSCRWQNCTQCTNQVLVKEMKGMLAFISNHFQKHFIPYWSSSTQMALPLLPMTYKQYLMTSAKLMASSIPGNAPRSSWTIFLPMDIISAWKRNKCGRQWWVAENADSCPVIADFTVILTVAWYLNTTRVCCHERKLQPNALTTEWIQSTYVHGIAHHYNKGTLLIGLWYKE